MSRADVSWRTATVAALLVAFVLRAHRLDGMSLWSDEDITADRAAMTASAMLADLPAEHTPVYFLSMIPWTRAAGGSDFALRYPSLLAGVLAVAAAAAAGAALVGRRAAMVFAIIMAINPFMVWYGQEARMYALLSALGLLALGAALVARRTGRRRWWVATGVLAALTVLVHYYGALTVAVLAAWAVLDVRESRRATVETGSDTTATSARTRRVPVSARSGWLITGAVALLVFAPWLPRAPGLLDYTGWREPVPLTDVPRINLVAWTAGETPAPGWTPAALAVYLGLAAAGGLMLAARARLGDKNDPSAPSAADRQRPAMATLALAFVLAPLAVAAVAVIRQPDFHPRYFTAVVPALYLWAAAGAVCWRWPALRMAAVAALVLAAVPSLSRLYGDPAAQKQDYRSWVALVEAAAGHEDTVLFLDGPSYGLTRRYEMDDSPVKIVNLKSSGNLEQSRNERVQEVMDLAYQYPHLWLATTGEAMGEAGGWLATHTFAVDEPQSFQAITLERFLGQDTDQSRAALEAASTAGDPGCAFGAPVCVSIGAPSLVTAGELLPVALRWSGPEDTWISLRLVSESGTVLASADGPAAWSSGGGPRGDPGGRSDLALFVPEEAAGSAHVEVHFYTTGGGELDRIRGPNVTVTASGSP